MSHNYAKYSPTDFDNYDCLKISKGIYLLIAFVLRGYFVWLMSVTNIKDRVATIKWIYPEPSLFYLSLFSGAGGLFVLLILSLRRPEASNWVRKSWQNLRVILICSLAFDLMVNLAGYFYWQLQSALWLYMNSLIVIVFAAFLFSSKRIQINIGEFPEKLPE